MLQFVFDLIVFPQPAPTRVARATPCKGGKK